MTNIRQKIIQEKIIPIESIDRAKEETEKFFEQKLISMGLGETLINTKIENGDIYKS